jgi:hypothetical protein
MTLWNPIWEVDINGVNYTEYTLANLTITSGRTNIYEQAQAGYVSMELINFNQTAIPFQINNSIAISVRNSANVLIPIFGGNITDLGVDIAAAGSVGFTQRISITALGALARLPKILTDGVLSKDYDGTQIADVLREVLFAQWSQVPAATQWNTYDPTIQWSNAQNSGYGQIDTPGNYELAARSSNRTDVYSLVSALATSGLGYIYEDAQGRIGYADSDHRSAYLAANGYVELSANHALASGISMITRAGDVRNSLTVKYDATSSSEESASDAASIALYGNLAQIITTTLHNSVDAQDQADFYLTLRAYPRAAFSALTWELTNNEISDSDRDSLIGIFMGMPVQVSNLPLNMNAGEFLGFVEGWTFSAAYNTLSVTLVMSPISFSLQAMRWNSVPVTEHWNTVNPLLTWENATLVA